MYIRLVDPMGKEIWLVRHAGLSFKKAVNVSDLPSGLYTLKVKADQNIEKVYQSSCEEILTLEDFEKTPQVKDPRGK